MKAEVIVLTNCTNRKRESAEKALRARSLPRGGYQEISQMWLERVAATPQAFVAQDLYCGRVVTETLGVAARLGAPVAFVSAGLGVVPQFQRIPAYSLTASEGQPDSVSGRLLEHYDSHRWWDALASAQGERSPVARHIDASRASLVLLAMPATYLGMVASDVADLTPRVMRTIRILGPRRPEEVHPRLREAWLPYDGRLDNPKTGINGTASDFPHRALRHFVTHVLKHNRRGGAQSHGKDVDTVLAQYSAYVRPRGQTASDQQVMAEIASLWKKHDGRRSSVLRELRSERKIACEQSRFRQLADKVEAKLNVA
jgi:hypothetical protein